MTEPRTIPLTAELETDTKFAEVLGEMRTSNAILGGKIDTAAEVANGKTAALQARIETLPGRFTLIGGIFAAVLSAAGVVLAALQFGGGMFGNGEAASQIAHTAAQEAVAMTRRIRS